MGGVTIITPTGGRPAAFALCERWVSQQTLQDWRWIVVDDGEPETRCTMGQTVIRARPCWQPGENTQARNLLIALTALTASDDKILIFQDDDFYAPGYLGLMSQRLEEAALVGEKETVYYHVGRRGYHVNRNKIHASLCQTGMRREMLPALTAICERGEKFIDLKLFAAGNGRSKLYEQTFSSIGIKGLPGRPGIGIGHRPRGLPWIADPDLKMLSKWIGADAGAYEEFGEQVKTKGAERLK